MGATFARLNVSLIDDTATGAGIAERQGTTVHEVAVEYIERRGDKPIRVDDTRRADDDAGWIDEIDMSVGMECAVDCGRHARRGNAIENC